MPPLSQAFTVTTYVLRQRLRGVQRYPLVLMLEPLFRCNLACAGCGKIQYPAHVLKRQLTPEECFRAGWRAFNLAEKYQVPVFILTDMNQSTAIRAIDPDREKFERALMAEVEKRRTPTLGICLGSQLMNVYRGGSMQQFIPEVPRTLSGKKMEVPVRKILLGHPIERSANPDAMANPASLDWFVAFARERRW